MATNLGVAVTVDTAPLVAAVERLSAEIRAAGALRAGASAVASPGAAHALAGVCVAAGATRRITRRALLGLAWRKG